MRSRLQKEDKSNFYTEALFIVAGKPRESDRNSWKQVEAKGSDRDCKNLTPHAGINGGVPDAIWHSIPQDLSRLHTFGCRAWATIPQHDRTKLKPKGIPLIFVDQVPCRPATCLRAQTALCCPYNRAAPRPGASSGTSRSRCTSDSGVAHVVA
ncbi:BQ5605_C051g12554 [Microbotryum silenes-dioicae]|uniref:BQ5605_C051g12554 protein n=1 Tax=Microbotryum silenes-dioicae TaxID=796604 RepID=A0A2X0MS34_9BASI|nr:BQ5605_C085g13009 [Microbotryum silenes-dioicae]SGZ29604.1 BQ5605_C051g12554 [Microbotryum silenes-dioicae]